MFTGGIIIIVLYIANLAAALKTRGERSSAILFALALLSLNLTGRGTRIVDSLIKSYSWEVLVYLIVFLLFGLFLIVFVVDKSLGALRYFNLGILTALAINSYFTDFLSQ